MTAYLDDHPPRRSQFRRPRRQQPSGVAVVHTAENTPDLVAFDGGAEAVARFIEGRDTPGSYHDLVDSDSAINLVDYANEAFHDGTGTNPHSYGLSVATRADVWPLAPKAWRDGAIEQAAQAAARYARWVKANYGITIPARRITAAQARARVPGFTSHGELDPGRRSDPGAAFPWDQFLARFAELTQQEDDMNPAQEEKLDATLEAIRKTYAAVVKTHAATVKVFNRVGDIDLDVDATEVARLVLEDLDGVTLSDEQVRAIIDALPGAVKQALREGTG